MLVQEKPSFHHRIVRNTDIFLLVAIVSILSPPHSLEKPVTARNMSLGVH